MNANIGMSAPAYETELVAEQTQTDRSDERAESQIRQRLRRGTIVPFSRFVALAQKLGSVRGLVLTRTPKEFYKNNE